MFTISSDVTIQRVQPANVCLKEILCVSASIKRSVLLKNLVLQEEYMDRNLDRFKGAVRLLEVSFNEGFTVNIL